jgi:hypothetical protein
MRRQKNIHPLVCLTVLLMLSLSCSKLSVGQRDTDQTDADVSPAATEAAAETEDGTSLPAGGGETPAAAATELPAGGGPEYLGDYAEMDGYFCAVTAVEDPGDPGNFFDALDRMRLVAVWLVVGNREGERLYFSISDVAIRDDRGDVWESQYRAHDAEIFSMYLEPGEWTQGWMGFVIPEDAEPVSLVYLYDFLEDKSVSLPLAEPPAGREPRTVDLSREPRTVPKLGQAVEWDGISMKAVDVENPSANPVAEFNTPPAGWHTAMVEIGLVNAGEETFGLFLFEFTIVDGDGFLHSVEFFSGNKEDLSELPDEIQPGESVSVEMWFFLPDGAEPESIKYFADGMDEPLYAGLAE